MRQRASNAQVAPARLPAWCSTRRDLGGVLPRDALRGGVSATRFLVLVLATCLVSLVFGSSCRVSVDEDDMNAATAPRIDVYFNYPGSRGGQQTDNYADDVLVLMIDRARSTVDFAAMGFSRGEVIDALVRAHRRGVRLRFVGDARHMAGNVYGYIIMDRLQIEMQVGNQNHIMHNKFFIVDGHSVYLGTGNISGSEFEHNNNNWLVISSPSVARAFTMEFQQMLDGRFGYAKEPVQGGNIFQVDDTRLELYFSPQEDAMGRLLEVVESAVESIEFTIFAFTKDEVGSLLIVKHREFEQYNLCCDPARTGERASAEVATACAADVVCEATFRRRYVRGVVDKSQLHSNGPYHEIYRLLAFGIDVRLDGNDNSIQPGDYQAGGGRLHSKTMVLDAGRESGVVVTGSFNWSASATLSNDETLLIMHSPRLAELFAGYFQVVWDQGKEMGERFVGDNTGLAPGDIVFNEIHWDGYNGDLERRATRDVPFSNDQFIELLNTTDQPIDMSLWTIATDEDFVVGLFPGTVIGPYERFLIVDHSMEPYDDVRPQFAGGAFQNANFVMNTANDPRFLRLNLHNTRFRLRLIDARGTVIDTAGDGGPPFAGGRVINDGETQTFSMERIHFVCPDGDASCSPIGDGTDPGSWVTCQATRGGENVREAYRDIVVATPGSPNSGGERFPDAPSTFRTPGD